MNSSNRVTRIVAALTLGVGTLIPALAVQAADAPSRVISYADLNLASPAGVEILYRRITDAAHAVCGSSHVAESVAPSAGVVQCRDKAIDDAVSAVHSAALTALAQSRGHAAPALLAKGQ